MSPRTLTHGEVVDLLSQLKDKGIDVAAIPDYGSSHHPPIPTDTPGYWQIRIGRNFTFTLYNSSSRYGLLNNNIWYRVDYISEETPNQHLQLVMGALERIVQSAQAEQPSQ